MSVTKRTSMLLFQPFFIIFFSRSLTVAVEQGHQRDAASSTSTSSILSVSDFEPLENLT